jgi:diacylglycerol kinase family enzyme
MNALEKGFDIAPLADISDASIDMILARDLSRAQIIDLLSGALNKGSHILKPTCDYLKAADFVLVPDKNSASRSWGEWLRNAKYYHDICVDGEMIKVEDGLALWVKLLDQNRQVFNCIV